MKRWGAKCPSCGKTTTLPIVGGKDSEIVGSGTIRIGCENCGEEIETTPDDLIRFEDE
jgi:hypothetical protein